MVSLMARLAKLVQHHTNTHSDGLAKMAGWSLYAWLWSLAYLAASFSRPQALVITVRINSAPLPAFELGRL